MRIRKDRRTTRIVCPYRQFSLFCSLTYVGLSKYLSPLMTTSLVTYKTYDEPISILAAGNASTSDVFAHQAGSIDPQKMSLLRAPFSGEALGSVRSQERMKRQYRRGSARKMEGLGTGRTSVRIQDIGECCTSAVCPCRLSQNHLECCHPPTSRHVRLVAEDRSTSFLDALVFSFCDDIN